jgi:nitrogen-specific signal transduction histidine kinase
MTKDRFGIRGEKAGLTGGTGQGGHIIKSIVEHYGGDYDVFQDDASTVVRIYLPIMR